jgi:hypothetical protein
MSSPAYDVFSWSGRQALVKQRTEIFQELFLLCHISHCKSYLNCSQSEPRHPRTEVRVKAYDFCIVRTLNIIHIYCTGVYLNMFLVYVLNTDIHRHTNNSLALVRKRTIPIERPQHIGEVSVIFCG